MINKNTPALWEERSKLYGTQIQGVLPKSYPMELNDYLDKWMYEQIAEDIQYDKKIKILDLGCGYGRLASRILKNFSKAQVIGMDISQTYVDLYNQNLKPRGRAYKGDIRKLPFRDNEFDLVYIVTTFMYLPSNKDQVKSLKEISRILKKSGKFIIIERNIYGQRFVNLWGFVNLIRGKRNEEIKAVNFSKYMLSDLINRYLGRIQVISGIPFWTAMFHINYLMFKLHIKSWVKVLQGISNLDKKFSAFTLPSLYICYRGEKLK